MLGAIGKFTGRGRDSTRGADRAETSSADRSTVDTSTLSFTGRLARWSATHRWWVVAASVLVLVAAMFVSSSEPVSKSPLCLWR